jgi:DNA-binding NarL/FixJ family response regulator
MKFLVVDDHVLIREAMVGVLKQLNADAVVLDAASYRQAIELIERTTDLALVLLDLRLPDRDGMEVLAELRERFPGIPVVMMSAFNDRDNVAAALDAGASGFIPKTDSREVLLSALRLILAGGKYIPPDILGRAPAPPRATAVPPTSSPPADMGQRRRKPSELGLTDRQIDVLALMMQGKSNKLICRALDLAEPTVKNHVSAILKALEVSNRTEAVLAAAQFNWEQPKSGS